jgi:hypothetical protein
LEIIIIFSGCPEQGQPSVPFESGFNFYIIVMALEKKVEKYEYYLYGKD